MGSSYIPCGVLKGASLESKHQTILMIVMGYMLTLAAVIVTGKAQAGS